MKIDLHTHILPQHWPDWTKKSGYAGWVALDQHGPGCARMVQTTSADASTPPRFFRDVQANLWDPAARLAEMDSLMGAASAQVLSTVPIMFSYWARPQDAYDLARLLNDHIAQVCNLAPVIPAPRASGTNPVAPPLKRFIGLGTIPMQDPDLAIRELERCMAPIDRGGLGLRGVQIGTNVNGLNLSDPKLFQVFQAAERLGAAVFVHPWDMLGATFDQSPRGGGGGGGVGGGGVPKLPEANPRYAAYWLAWLVGMPAETCMAVCAVIFSGLLEKLPRLRICFAHGGGSFAGTIGRIDHGYHARPDLCATETKRSPREQLSGASRAGHTAPPFYVDSLVHDADTLRSLIRLMGEERIALGSDYPFPLGEDKPGALIESMSDLSPQVRHRLLAFNAIDFLFGMR